MNAKPAKNQDLFLALGLLVAALLWYAFLAGSLHVRLPDVHYAQGSRIFLSWIVGLAVIALGGLLAHNAFKARRTGLAVLAIVALFAGLTTLGSTTGVPRIFVLFVPFLQGIVDLLNALAKIIAALLRFT